MNRAEILERARVCVCGERETDYGSPEDNFSLIATLWTAYLGRPTLLTPQDVGVMMALLKIARIATGKGSADSFVDLAGYAACAGEIATRQQSSSNENRCLYCGELIPEGAQVCNNCMRGVKV